MTASSGTFSTTATFAISGPRPQVHRRPRREHSPRQQPLRFLVLALRYTAGLVENILHDSNRGDFWMMFTHHILTLILIYGALCSDAHRIGLCVMTTLDIGDIWMYGTKVGRERSSGASFAILRGRNIICDGQHAC